jgi:hypothetical protein
MPYRILADIVVVSHAAFVVFVVAGGLLVLRWKWLRWIHLPMVLWAAAVELIGWPCPLTPLENRLRHLAGEAGYDGGFIEHYLWPVIYPEAMTREHQIVLAGVVLLINFVVYLWLWRRTRK